MTLLLIGIVAVIGALIGVALYRVARGPTIFDRLVGVALAAANSVVVLLLIGFIFERPAMFVDIALAYTMLAFLFPVALAKYLDTETGEGTGPADEPEAEEGRP